MKPKRPPRRIIDPLGRIVLPKKLRRSLDINIGDALELFIDGEKVVLQRYTPGCIFCEETQGVSTFQEKHICQKCLDVILKTT